MVLFLRIPSSNYYPISTDIRANTVHITAVPSTILISSVIYLVYPTYSIPGKSEKIYFWQNLNIF